MKIKDLKRIKYKNNYIKLFTKYIIIYYFIVYIFLKSY